MILKNVLIFIMKDPIASLCFLGNNCGILFSFVLDHTIKADRIGEQLFICPTHFFFN